MLKVCGGKGVASAFGAFLVLSPRAALAGFALWIVVLVIGSRTVGLNRMIQG